MEHVTNSMEEIRRLRFNRHFMAKLRNLLLKLEPITDQLKMFPSKTQMDAAAIVLIMAIDSEVGGIQLLQGKDDFYFG